MANLVCNLKSIVSFIFSQTTEFIPLLRCLFTSPSFNLSDYERGHRDMFQKGKPHKVIFLKFVTVTFL